MRLFKWLSDNVLFVITASLLVFIPLYPKLPLIDIKNTWVYIRAEDFFVAFALLVWLFFLIRKKVSLRTPLTIPIMLFWLVGALATIHAVLIIFPTLSNIFPNVAFLSYLRRIEYISLFFIAFSGIKDKRLIPVTVLILVVTLLLVVAYGFGQRFLGFPAYLTMNEEYAKGVPIVLSPQSRVPSTFAGHYDLAAYLILVIPIVVSMIFGFRNWLIRIILLATSVLGFVLLLMTVSRVSFFVLLIALVALLYFQKRKILLYALPVGAIALIVLSVQFSTNLIERFGNTVNTVDVLVDARTGDPIGHTKKVATSSFANKPILRRDFGGRTDLDIDEYNPMLASSSALVPLFQLPLEVIAVVPLDTPTGENLPQGTGYINLALSPVTERSSVFFLDRVDSESPEMVYVTMFEGNFLVKRTLAYDLSFTTRFQGEWPHAIAAFKRNILFGSGYSSVSLAVDNNFLRILGEIGLLGFLAFFGIFLMGGMYVLKMWRDIPSPVLKSFVIGFAAGVLGLFLNAVFIDVFEASKVAYVLWLLMGVTIGAVSLYQTKQFSVYTEIRRAATSHYAVIIYLCLIGFILYWPMVGNYYIGDDFTWLRWASDCGGISSPGNCPPLTQRIGGFFTQSDGFFYRPGTKVFFSFMYSFFWLNQEVYHMVSIVLHTLVAILFFLLARKVTRRNLFASLSAFLFLILSGYAEVVFWISSIGFLFNAVFMLTGLLLFIKWEEKKQIFYYLLLLASFAFALFFHEIGVVGPLLILAYKFVTDERFSMLKIIKKVHYQLFAVMILAYWGVRFFAQSHWFSGDYNYNILKLPFNFVGNAIGYVFLVLFGQPVLSIHEKVRNILNDHVLVVALLSLVGILAIGFYLLQMKGLSRLQRMLRSVSETDRRVLIFGLLFFVIPLLPFLGLGNITSRYSYLASLGIVVLLVFALLKLYEHLLRSGRDIAIVSFGIALSIFSLFHIVQIQKAHNDWHEAGLRTKRFITTINALYQSNWGDSQMKFHFVNVPIHVGSAWMFPVGLDDAIWFIFQNPRIAVYKDQSVEEALGQIEDTFTEKVFVFEENGSVKEVKKRANVESLQ